MDLKEILEEEKEFIKENLKLGYSKSEDESYEDFVFKILKKKFENYSDDEIRNISREIIQNIDEYNSNYEEIQKYKKRGLNRDNYIADKILEQAEKEGYEETFEKIKELTLKEEVINSEVSKEIITDESSLSLTDKGNELVYGILKNSLAVPGVLEGANYISGIKNSIDSANQLMTETLFTKSGAVSQNPNLHGYIFEAHHTSTFNIDSAVKGIDAKAEMLNSNLKDSTDILIKSSGKKIGFQAKDGETFQKTYSNFKRGDYGRDKLLVPESQAKEIAKKGIKPVEEISFKGAKSQKISYEETKEIQINAQEKGQIKTYGYSDTNLKDVAIKYSKVATSNFVMGAGYGMVSKVVRDKLSGEDVELDELVCEGIKTGSDYTVKTVLASALVNKLSTNVATGVAFSAVEMAKTAYECMEGNLDTTEALDRISDVGASTIAGTVGSIFGAKVIGGFVGGLLGSAIGGLVGSAAGYTVGSTVGVAVSKGVKSIAKGAVSIASSVVSGVSSFVGSLFGW